MSRYTIKNGPLELAYGFDHALGYFYDITNNEHPDDSADHTVESKCSFIDGLNRGDFAKVLEHWGARETHIMAVALDQPF